MYNNKKIGLIIPLRYNSSRLPGKVLMEIAGIKQIERIIKRSLKSKYIDNIILAVSNEPENQIIHQWWKNSPYKECVIIDFGNHNNIMKRCITFARKYNIDIIIDTSSDCTFFDPDIADILIERLFEYNADYSSNCIVRSFPDGFDIQVYTKEIYEKIYENGLYNPEWTGWNIWHYREEIFPKPKIVNYTVNPDYYFPEWRLCLDTEKDKILIEKILQDNKLYCDYKQIINYLKKNLYLLDINKDIKSTKLLSEDIK